MPARPSELGRNIRTIPQLPNELKLLKQIKRGPPELRRLSNKLWNSTRINDALDVNLGDVYMHH